MILQTTLKLDGKQVWIYYHFQLTFLHLLKLTYLSFRLYVKTSTNLLYMPINYKRMHSHKPEQVNKETSIKPANTLINTVLHAALYNNVQHSQAKTDSLVQYVIK